MNVFNLGQTIFQRWSPYFLSFCALLMWLWHSFYQVVGPIFPFSRILMNFWLWWKCCFMTSEARSQNSMKLLLGHLPLESSHHNVTRTQWASWRAVKLWWKREVLFLLHMSHKICSSILVFPGNCDCSSLSFFINKMDALNKMNFKLLVLMCYYFLWHLNSSEPYWCLTSGSFIQIDCSENDILRLLLW